MREYIVKLSDEDVEGVLANDRVWLLEPGHAPSEALVAGIIRQILDQWSARRDKIIAEHLASTKEIAEHNALMKEAYESGNLETPAPDE